jgi:hypothetical protein
MNDDSDEEEEDRTIRSVEVSIAGEGTASAANLLKVSLLHHFEARTVKEVRAE